MATRPTRMFWAGLALVALLGGTTAQAAGPVAQFETQLRTAYGNYRAALLASNQGDAAATKAALDRFAAQWGGLMADWRTSRPPQYADDPAWSDTLAKVAATLDAAKQQVAAGNLVEAHKTLEAVRKALAQLHVRNGVIGFSDRMNAYHAEMEKVLALDPALYTGKVAPEVVELAGVLDYLMSDIESHPAPEASSDPDYAALLLAFRASVTDFVDAAAAGDPAKVKAAIAGLKPAYSRFFVKFG